MPEATLKVVAQRAGVAPVTVSRVVNGSENVASATREKILAIIRELDYTPNLHAAYLRRRRLSGASASGDRCHGASKRLPEGCHSGVAVPRAVEEAVLFGAQEGRALAQQLIRLRRDLDRLREHTERIQSCVDILQEACSRR